MTILNIRHKTTYRYREPVRLGPHRLMLRPRESHEVRLLSSAVEVTPAASISWASDVFGNAVGTVHFQKPTAMLEVESRATVELAAQAWPVFDIGASAIRFPFSYSADEKIDLGALTVPQYRDPSERLGAWARGFVRGAETDTLSLLKDMVAGVSAGIGYQSREEEGTQSPLQTLDRGWGSCRDFAVLFAEAARNLGFGARIISGYIYDQATEPGTTHAWAEIFLPGAGWITFDPTSRSVGGFNLIPLAVGRGISQVMPLTGSFLGMTDAYQGMTVEVDVRP